MYKRTTHESSLAALPSDLTAALRAHASQHQLELDAGVRVWLTHSENPPATGFVGKLLGRRANPVDPDAEHDTAVVLHRTHLLLGTMGARRGVVVSSLPLMQASLSTAPFVATVSMDGVTISGFPGVPGAPGSIFVGLGAPAGPSCASAIEEAIRAAKGPPA